MKSIYQGFLLFILVAAASVSQGQTCNASFTYNSSGGVVMYSAVPEDSTWDYSWDFGDGNIGFGPYGYNAYAQSGMYNVCLTVVDSANNCTSTFCDSVSVVVPNCTTSFSFTADSTGMVSFTVDTAVTGFDYSWDFGDFQSGSGPNVTHTYFFSGDYVVCLSTMDTTTGCFSSFCDTVSVIVPVNCAATFISVPVNQSATFIVQGMNPGMTYTFSFGDNTTGAPNAFGFATHNYSTGGSYYVCLEVNDSASGCTSTYCDTVVITSCPITAGFNIVNLGNGKITAQADVNGFYTYTWAILAPPPEDTLITGFGRDTISYTFTTNGFKQVCLSVVDLVNTSCRDSLCKLVSVSGIGIEELAILNESVSVYPNPANDQLTLKFSLRKNQTGQVVLSDLTGKTVIEYSSETYRSGEHSVIVGLNNLARGTYILRLRTEDGEVIRRVTRN